MSHSPQRDFEVESPQVRAHSHLRRRDGDAGRRRQHRMLDFHLQFAAGGRGVPLGKPNVDPALGKICLQKVTLI